MYSEEGKNKNLLAFIVERVNFKNLNKESIAILESLYHCWYCNTHKITQI